MSRTPRDALERVFREEHGRVVASLARRFGDLDIAEEAVGEAVVVALERWSVDGLPPNPGAWLTTTATRRAIDRIRRENRRSDKHHDAMRIHDDQAHEPVGVVADDRLRLLFTCCHPALSAQARVALTLRLLGGLTVAEIARAFLVPEPTMAQRITRAKAKIKAARVPYRVPGPQDLPQRLATVLAVIYLIYNEGYLSTSDREPVRDDLCDEAIRLARVLHELMPGEPEATGLLALLLLTHSRRATRVAGNELVPLHEQDRGGWNRPLIDEGHALVRECLAIDRPGRYQLLAAINAVHADAPTAADTDWTQVLQSYDRLLALDPGPVVALNRAVAVAEVDGPEVALAIVEQLPLEGYHAWHATRAELLRRLGRSAEAGVAYDAAIASTDNLAERAWLVRRRSQLAGRT